MDAMLDENPSLAVVLADITYAALKPAPQRHPDRVINLGIREQLLVSVTGGLALAGLRPVAHTFSPPSWSSGRSSRSSSTSATRTWARCWSARAPPTT